MRQPSLVALKKLHAMEMKADLSNARSCMHVAGSPQGNPQRPQRWQVHVRNSETKRERGGTVNCHDQLALGAVPGLFSER